MGKPLTPDTLYSRCAPEPNTGCWIWEGYARYITPNYLQPEAGFEGRKQRVANIAWKLFNGSIPAGAWVLHRCHVSECVNPAHLYLGNSADNMRDLRDSGRGRNKHKKITKEDLKQMRWLHGLGLSNGEIASAFGIYHKSVSRLLNGRGPRV